MNNKETPIEELPAGTDESELYADQNEQTIFIPYKGKKWEFTIRDLTWAESLIIASKSARMHITNGRSGDAMMNLLEGHIAHLLKVIVKAPFPVTRASFLKLDKEFGRLLIEYIIEGKTDGRDEKNSEQPSEDET